MGWWKDSKTAVQPKKPVGRIAVIGFHLGKPIFGFRKQRQSKEAFKDANKPLEKQEEINAAVADIDPELNDTLDDLWQGTEPEKKLFELMKRDGKKKL